VYVILVQPAGLGNLRAAGENHAGIHLQHDVRSAGVLARIIEFVDQRLPRENLLNTQRC
jgi:hypothetical protein